MSLPARLRLDPAWVAARPALHPERRAAAALGNRLLEVEDDILALRAEISRLRVERDAAFSGNGGGSTLPAWFDVPRTRFPWKLAEQPLLDPQTLDKYDRRVDDDVVLEGRRGEAFLSRHGLLCATPDFAGAIAELNAAAPALRLVAGKTTTPDISIVIPIYGQLAYVLNALASLLSHGASARVEIIVVDDASPDQSGQFLPKLKGIRYVRQPKNAGFIATCNAGARLARGGFVVMLNSDTRVVPGWLDTLVESFRLFPRAGFVGSKLCYPDGSLQEAGGILWRDGHCWNYGRNDDPNRPQYSYARQVDYVSGASMMVPAELWRSVGGFDPHFAPAYCEDVDLCLRIIKAGHEVWYQPQSRVVHYEGKTSGTDTATGTKAYQVVNTKKVYLRWREPLEAHRPRGEAPYFERERGVRRRMLVVDATAPTPNQDAGSVQTVLGLRVCRLAGYKTHFVPEDNWLFQDGYITDLQKGGIECGYAPYDLGFANYIRRYGKLFDVIMVYRMSVLERVLSDIRTHAPQAALLFHLADLHFLRRRREAELEGSAAGLEEAEAIKAREFALINAADCTITHSPVEAAVLARETPAAPVAVWPLMQEYFGTSVPFARRRDICFLGGYRHPPNIDAVRYFVAEILPLLRTSEPDLRFIIAGANPSREVSELAGEGVEVTGLIDDLRELFDRTRVFVCPLRVGAGVKGKVMSALSYGLPVVSTPIGVEGAQLTEDQHVLVADTPAAFARKTLQLYRDKTLWNALSRAGQALIKREFCTTMGQDALRQAVDKAHHRRLGL
jgi:GT2 family glycosyltransferase